jgi:eukaryotic-like serine/threonine-protein kinase
VKIKTILYLSLIIFVASLTCAPRAIAQVPCGPTILPKASLFVNWPQLQYDPGHSGCNPYETILSTSTVGTLGLKWKQTAYTAFSSPVVADGVVYAGRFSDPMHLGEVVAFNANTGSQLWSYEPPQGIVQFSSPAVASGVVYAGGDDSNLYALDAKTGQFLWSYATGATVSTPVVADGVVYAGSQDDKLYALDAQTGHLLWMYATGGPVPTAAVKGGVVYVASDQVYALNASTGALIWKYPIFAYSSSAPAVVGNSVYITSDQVYALNASTGALIWKYPVASLTTPAIATGRVYVGAEDASVYALNASTGAFLWKYAQQDELLASPVAANGVVYVISYLDLNGYAHLNVLDAKTGALLCLRPSFTGEDSASSAVVANGVVYFSTSSYDAGGILHAFSITQGH